MEFGTIRDYTISDMRIDNFWDRIEGPAFAGMEGVLAGVLAGVGVEDVGKTSSIGSAGVSGSRGGGPWNVNEDIYRHVEVREGGEIPSVTGAVARAIFDLGSSSSSLLSSSASAISD